MRILVTGANGMLGFAVNSYFNAMKHDVLSITRSEFDIAKEPFLVFERIILNFKPDLIINCSGVIKPQIAKNSIEDVLRVNSIFPHNLAKFSVKNKIKTIHITTDCVYSGLKGKYTETDYYDATDVYGMSKNSGEPTNIMTLRTSIIGEERGQGRSLLEWARGQKDKEVNGFTNHRWNGLTTVRLAQAIEQIINNNLYETGLFHLHSPDMPTKFELLQMLSKTYKLNLKIKAIEAADYCDRTLSSDFNLASKLIKETVAEQIDQMSLFFKEVKSNAN